MTDFSLSQFLFLSLSLTLVSPCTFPCLCYWALFGNRILCLPSHSSSLQRSKEKKLVPWCSGVRRARNNRRRSVRNDRRGGQTRAGGTDLRGSSGLSSGEQGQDAAHSFLPGAEICGAPVKCWALCGDSGDRKSGTRERRSLCGI